MHTSLVFNNLIAFMLVLQGNLNFILAAPVNNEPKTMFEALAEKCPNLNQTTLKDNEQFTKRCLEWDQINATTQLTASTKSNVQCLVLYEAALKFCVGIGHHILQVKELIPSTESLQKSNMSLEQVCRTENGIYPKTNTEHNISSLVHNNEDCLLLCGDFKSTHTSDICIWSYFFSTFNTSKFTQNLDKIHQHQSEVNNNIPAESKPNPVGVVEASAKLVPTLSGEKAATKLPSHMPPQNKLPETVPVGSHQLEQSQKPVVVGEVAENHDEKSVKPGTQVGAPSLPEQNQDSHVDVVTNEVTSEDTHKGVQDNKKPENERPPETNPEQVVKPETNPEKAPQENEENEAYINEDKSQNNIADDVDRDLGIDDEDEQQEGEVKAEPALPDENNNEIKVTSKKGKPASTVEDEAVSSFSLPEDDMDGDSYFFSYFTVIMCLIIVGYVGYHNRQKVLALILEGKKGRRPGRARRPNSANYHKLDSNLEEAISSSCTKNASNVIY